MKFYDRTEELEALKKIEKTSAKYAQMTIITGRRRIGKTTLIRKAFTGIPFVYFFVGKKSESLLCKELVEIIREELGEELVRETFCRNYVYLEKNKLYTCP